MASIKPGCSFPIIFDDFPTTLDDFRLVKMVDVPIRCENIRDFFLTLNHILVQKILIVQIIADPISW